MQTYRDEDIANQGLEILSATNSWLLTRHQWLIDTMRCMLTGESPPPADKLKTLDYVIPQHLQLSDHLMHSFTEIKDSLESNWLDATSAIHPMSGLTVFEQLNTISHLRTTSCELQKKPTKDYYRSLLCVIH